MSSESAAQRFPLGAETLQRLDNLALVTRKALATGRPGRRRSPLAGSSLEFSDYRRYAPGDDFRRIDWRAYARLERLFLRVFEAEENITVTILVDSSASMWQGTPPKSTQVIQLAAALAYIALKNEDTVIMGALAERMITSQRVGSGKQAIWSVGEFLNNLPRTGTTDLNRALYDLGRIVKGPGMTIVLSDFMAPNGYQVGLRALRQLRQEVALLQVLAPDELEPELQGDWNLKDSESGARIAVSAGPAVLQAYRQRLAQFTQELTAFAHNQAMTYSLVPSNLPISEVVQRILRQVELVR